MSDEKYPIVEVNFQDITTYSTWDSPDCIKEEKPILCRAVGYLVEETDDFIRLIFMYAPSERWAERIIIPKGIIIDRKILG